MFLTRVLAVPVVYRLWQRPFAQAKLAPLFRHNDVAGIESVLDVGCGPGTNSREFAHARYCGVDVNDSYIKYARRHCPGRFVHADVSSLRFDALSTFEMVLVNSLLHHLDDKAARATLAALRHAVAENGHLHVVDLVAPTGWGLARGLASMDRGRFARPLAAWHRLLTEYYAAVVLEPFELRVAGCQVWKLVYFKGEPRQ